MRTRNFFDLLIFKTLSNLRAEVSKYYLNYMWWVIEPVMTMMVFYFVFSIFLNRGKEHFVAFLLCGLVNWSWFTRTTNNAASSILNGRMLMLQVDIPKVFFPTEVLLRDFVKYLFALSLLLIFLLFYPTPVGDTWLALPIIISVQFVINAGAAFICAALVPFLPDLQFVIQTLLQLGLFGSGIFYSVEDVIMPQHRYLMYLNPYAGLLKNYREVLIYGHWPDWGYLFMVLCAGLVFLGFGVWLISKFDHVYPRICQR